MLINSYIYNTGITIDTTNLVSYYNFEDNANDLVGTNNGTATNVVYNASGIIGKSLELDGTGSYVTIPDDNTLSFTNGLFSICLWARFDNLTGGNLLVSKRSGVGAHEYQLGINDSGNLEGTIFDGDSTDFLQVEHTWSPSLNTWYHIAFTSDGTQTNAGMKLYIDGSEVATVNDNQGTFTAMINTTAPVYLGIFGPIPTNPASLEGQMDLVQIWSEELTLSKIKNIYDTENAGNLITS
jgi:hypothetical protein